MINLRRIFLLAGAIAALLMSCLPAAADDTEIFTASPSLSASRPNVLIILDSSANWSANFGSTKKFDAEMAALSAIVGGLSDEVNLGLMLFAESGGGTPFGRLRALRAEADDEHQQAGVSEPGEQPGHQLRQGLERTLRQGDVRSVQVLRRAERARRPDHAGYGPIAFAGFGRQSATMPATPRTPLPRTCPATLSLRRPASPTSVPYRTAAQRTT